MGPSPAPLQEFTRNSLSQAGRGEMKIFDMNKGNWQDGPKPPKSVYWAATATSRRQIFICSGRGEDDEEQRSACLFEVESGRWVPLPQMVYARNEAGALYLDSCLHVVGGWESNATRHERLDLRTSKWEVLAELPGYRGAPALACHESKVVVSGGSDVMAQRTVYEYDDRGNSWRELPSMVERRYRHGLIPLKDKLYAVGGKGTCSVEAFDGSSWEVVKRFDLSTCERACLGII